MSMVPTLVITCIDLHSTTTTAQLNTGEVVDLPILNLYNLRSLLKRNEHVIGLSSPPHAISQYPKGVDMIGKRVPTPYSYPAHQEVIQQDVRMSLSCDKNTTTKRREKESQIHC